MHLKGVSECYECVERPRPKGFAVCTIRNTPDKPIHCVVWAKDLLFARLFGPPDAVTDLDEPAEGEAAKDGKTTPPAGAFAGDATYPALCVVCASRRARQ